MRFALLALNKHARFLARTVEVRDGDPELVSALYLVRIVLALMGCSNLTDDTFCYTFEQRCAYAFDSNVWFTYYRPWAVSTVFCSMSGSKVVSRYSVNHSTIVWSEWYICQTGFGYSNSRGKKCVVWYIYNCRFNTWMHVFHTPCRVDGTLRSQA